MSSIDPYDWASRHDVCIALVEGRNHARVFDALVPDRATEITTAAAARQWVDDNTDVERCIFPTMVELDQKVGWTLVVQHHGFRATLDGPLAAVSRGTRAVILLWFGSTGHSNFKYAVDGVVARQFEPNHRAPPGLNAWEGRMLAEEKGLPFDYRPFSGFALLERLTGIVLTADDLGFHDDRLAIGLRLE